MTNLNEWVDHSQEEPIIHPSTQYSQEKAVIKDVVIKSGDIEVPAYIVEPALGEGAGPGIHFIHWLETKADNSNRTQFLPMAIELAEKGVVSVLPDCFWSVDRERYEHDPSEYHSRWWRTDVEHDLDLIRTQLRKLMMSEAVLKNHPRTDIRKLGLGAHDFGAMFACLLASEQNPYCTMAFMAMTSRFSDWFRFGSKLSEEDLKPYIEALDFIDPINHIGRLSPSDLHLGFATDDFYVPKERAESIFHNANDPKKMTWYEADHGMNEKAYQDLKEHLTSTLLRPV